MEIAASPMTARQRDYRRQYRERIVGWYSGWVHVGVIYAIGLTAMYIYATNLRAVTWWEWITGPVVFLLCNTFEWFIHRNVMHRPQRFSALRAIYTRHTLMHHQFFTGNEMRSRITGIGVSRSSTLRARCLHPDVNSRRAVSRLGDLHRCRLADDVHHDGHVSHL